MRIHVERGVAIPLSVERGDNHVLQRHVATRGRMPASVSVARHTHPVTYLEAEVFVRATEVAEAKVESADAVIDDLMANAVATRDQHLARVGAVLLTSEGSTVSAAEVPPPRRLFDLGDLKRQSGAASIRRGFDADDIFDLVDSSTAIHAEMQVIVEALRKGASPSLLVTTRIPCLACCRLIRAAGAKRTIYLHGRYMMAPGLSLRRLMKEALGDSELLLFEGIRTGGP